MIARLVEFNDVKNFTLLTSKPQYKKALGVTWNKISQFIIY